MGEALLDCTLSDLVIVVIIKFGGHNSLVESRIEGGRLFSLVVRGSVLDHIIMQSVSLVELHRLWV